MFPCTLPSLAQTWVKTWHIFWKGTDCCICTSRKNDTRSGFQSGLCTSHSLIDWQIFAPCQFDVAFSWGTHSRLNLLHHIFQVFHSCLHQRHYQISLLIWQIDKEIHLLLSAISHSSIRQKKFTFCCLPLVIGREKRKASHSSNALI